MRTGEIQKTVAAANYLADKDRAMAVGKGAVKATQVGISAVGGNYWGAALQGAQLAQSSA